MMSQVDINDLLPEHAKLRPCAYHPAHLVTSQRLAKHMLNCKKQFPNPRLKHCKFNFLHVVDKDEIEAHESVCSDNFGIKLAESPAPQLSIAPEKFDMKKARKVFIESEEDWDDEEKVPTYNPKKYMEERKKLQETPGWEILDGLGIKD